MGRAFKDDRVPGSGRLHNGSNQRYLYKKLSSETGFKGLLKKIVMFIVIAVSFSIQELIGNTIPLREVVIMFYICNEALSLLENAAVFVPIPDKLKDVLIQLRDKDTEEDTEGE